HLARRQLGQVLLPLLQRPEQHQRHRADADVGAEADRERSLPAGRLGDQAAAGLVAAEAAELLGHVVAQQAYGAGLHQQLAHEARLLGLDVRDLRQHLADDEVVSRLLHHALLVGQHLRGEDRHRASRLEQETTTGGQGDRGGAHLTRISARVTSVDVDGSGRRRNILIGAAIFVAAAALRLSLVETARFTGDEARDYAIGMDIAHGARFPMLGPIITNGPAQLPGPFSYWLAGFPQLFSRAPEAGNVFFELLGAASVWMFWFALRRPFGDAAATFAAALLAFS